MNVYDNKAKHYVASGNSSLKKSNLKDKGFDEETKKHNRNVIELFLKHGYDVNETDNEGKTIVHYCIKQNDSKSLRLLLQMGLKLNENADLLFIAAQKEFVGAVKVLLEFGADVNVYDEFGQTALHYAILQGRSRFIQSRNYSRNECAIGTIVEDLLKKGVNVNKLTTNGFAALHYAVQFEYVNVVSLLLEYGADVHMKIEEFIKHPKTGECFCVFDHIMSLCASRSNGHNSRDGPWKDSSTTILHIAVRKNLIEIAKMLLKAGAEVDAVQQNGLTSLEIAVGTHTDNSEELVAILLKYGADINFRGKNGATPLYFAVINQNCNMVALLLDKGVLVDSFVCKGKTALIVATDMGYLNVVDTLLAYEANIDQIDTEGMTPLHIACNGSHPQIVAAILAAGADVNVTDFYNRVPYKVAADARRHSIYLANESKIRNSVDVLKQLHEHITVMNVLKLPLHYTNKTNSSKMSYFGGNKQDFIKFKTKTVYNNLTISSILKYSLDPAYVMNNSVMEALDTIIKEVDEKNTNLRNVMRFVVRKAKLRFVLLNASQEWLLNLIDSSNSQLPALPREICRKIMSFINDEGLRNLLENI